MFKKGKLNKVLVITMLLILTLSTVAIAANNIYEKKLTATHGRIKFKVDGKDVTKEIENKYGSPAFTVREYGDRSYVPVRAIAELMGMEIEYDNSTHTAEIIDIKSKEHLAETVQKDSEIQNLKKENEELKKEIEKLKKNVVDETDLKSVEKKLNNEYGTYKDVDFDIVLKESKSRIDVDIVVDLRDGREESAWLRMGHNNKKDMIEDITDIVSSEFKNVDIYGSIYDEFYREDLMSFSKKKGSKVSISYDGRTSDRYGEYYIDDVVYEEFDREDIRNATISRLDTSGRTISFRIDFSSSYEDEWDSLKDSTIEYIMDTIADEVSYYYDDYYYDSHYDDYYYRYVEADIYMGNSRVAEYDRDLDYRDGRLTFRK